MNATQLAEVLSLSKGRISQLVAAGTLDGCFSGEGRRRVFDPRKAAEALGKRLDPGQRLGNGAASEAARLALLADDARPGKVAPPKDGTRLAADDDDRYKLARTQKAEEEARRLRRANAEDEGRYVLAEAAAREMRRLAQAEIAAFETVIRDGARAIADELGVDFKTARAILRTSWRTYRAARAAELETGAAAAELSGPEAAANI